MISTRKKILSFVLTAVGLFLLFIFAVNTGSLKVTPSELFCGLFIEYNPDVATIYDLRFPRIFIAMLLLHCLANVLPRLCDGKGLLAITQTHDFAA